MNSFIKGFRMFIDSLEFLFLMGNELLKFFFKSFFVCYGQLIVRQAREGRSLENIFRHFSMHIAAENSLQCLHRLKPLLFFLQEVKCCITHIHRKEMETKLLKPEDLFLIDQVKAEQSGQDCRFSYIRYGDFDPICTIIR